MSSFPKAAFTWLIAFGVTYVAMIIVNTLGGMVHGHAMSYGSSRLYQEVTGFAQIALHVLPAVAVGRFVPQLALRTAFTGSLLYEVLGNMGAVGRDSLPYVGDPIAVIVTYVLLGTLAAHWMASRRTMTTGMAP